MKGANGKNAREPPAGRCRLNFSFNQLREQNG
jgi:hypothetical protein